ncbi:type I restriction endonuclease subunit R, EcoR124 family [Helicobacter bilis]|uniref:type I restriction endonuclease subunit R, EcoR124 family n=1 Tax=Helicobacter bilis TaxID=37372 RepID=UPI003988D5BA
MIKRITSKIPTHKLFRIHPNRNAKKGLPNNLWQVLKIHNILEVFDDFSDQLSERDKQDYQSYYLETYQNLKSKPYRNKQ